MQGARPHIFLCGFLHVKWVDYVWFGLCKAINTGDRPYRWRARPHIFLYGFLYVKQADYVSFGLCKAINTGDRPYMIELADEYI
jgi:hypothetical protein